MSSWRDDLPPIPSERIVDGAVREGARRLARRREQRRRALTFGGVGLAAVAVVGLVTASLVRGPSSDDGADSAATEAPAGTAAPAATEAPGATEPEGTTANTEAAASETTEAAEATAPGATEAPGPPVSDEVVVAPAGVWELGPSGTACGATDIVVTYQPEESTVTAATVRWSVAAASVESPMIVTDGVATATIGPFPPETLVDGGAEEVLVVVTAVDTSGASRELRSPTAVVLRDCPG